MMTPSVDSVRPSGRCALGFLGGLLAGMIIGIVESIVVAAGGVELPDMGIFPYAVLSYGILSAFLGLGLGVVGFFISHFISLKRPAYRVFSFYLSVVLILEGIIIGRFRIIRDVFHEKHPGPMLDLGLFVSAVIIFFLLYRLVFSPLFSRKPFSSLTRAAWAVPFYIIVFIVTLIMAGGYGKLSHPAVGSQSEEAIARLGDRPNIILIIVDTLRADRLSCYGYEKMTSPNVDLLAADGLLFLNAFSQASWTRSSIASVLTSLYPSSHRAIGKPDQLPDQVVTLAEALKQAGYYTVGFVDNVNIAPVFNFHQGFDEYHYLAPDHFFYAPESATQLIVYNQLRLIRERFLSKNTWVEFYYQDAAVVTDRTIDWLEKNREKKFFLLIHYMDPHDPYFSHPYTGEGYARVSLPKPPPEIAAKLSELYDGEIAYFDAEFGRLRDWLIRNGLYDGTLIMLTADHGEEFYEHSGWWHGTTLYEEQIHVPLILKTEDTADTAEVVTSLARSIDIPPTLLSLADVEIPSMMQGVSLVDSMGESTRDLEYIFSEEDFEGNVLKAVRGKHRKLISANENNPRGLSELELFDLVADPYEMKNLAGVEVEIESQLKRWMEDSEAYALERSVGAQKGEIDEATQERLKALGYVE
ncbi:MAG: sulfatase [Candidatus Glassbacteria bacterium]